MSNLYNIQEETAEFKLDVSDENIKRNTMKIVWMFPGVTFVDIKEKGILKVRGNFDQTEMGKILYYEIDESVDFINPTKKSEKNQNPVLATVYNYFNTPETQELVVVVFEFRVLDERIIPKAMEVIWEFPGVTSVEVENDFYLRVKGGEFNQLLMTMQLKDIDRHVKIIPHGQDVETEPKKQSDIGSSKLRIQDDIKMKKMYGDAFGVPAPKREPLKKQQGTTNQAEKKLLYDAARGRGYMNNQNADWQQQQEVAYGAHALGHGPFNQQNRGFAAQNLGKKKKQPGQVKQQNQEAGVFAKMLGLNNEQPQVKQQGYNFENRNAQRFDLPIKRASDVNNPYARRAKEAERSLAPTIGSKRSSFSRSISATDLSQSIPSSSTAYSSQYSTLPTSSRNPSHSRSRSSENLSLSNDTWNFSQSLKSIAASGSKQGKSSTQKRRN